MYDIARQVRSTASRVFFDLQSAYCARQVRGCCGIRYRAARLRLYLRAGALTCSLLISFVFYKETAFCLYRLFFIRNQRLAFDRFFWLHQGGIPRHTCRFHCCLAAHQRTKEKDSAEPLSSILWTPPPHPGVIRCGGAYWLPRAYRDIVSLSPVQVAYTQFRIWFCFLCSGLGLSRFSRVVGLGSFVFHYWGEGLFVPAATVGLAMVYSWICADRGWGVCFCG